jgi:DNA-binding transcriptional MerR regulator
MNAYDEKTDAVQNERKSKATAISFGIGELARMFGVTTRTIRFYEESGLIAPIDREGGAHRKFGPRTLIYLRRIQQLKEYGLSLSEIGELFELSRSDRSGGLVRERLIAAYNGKIEEAKKKRKVIDDYIEDLSWHVEQLERVDDFFECPGAACARCKWATRCDLAVGSGD